MMNESLSNFAFNFNSRRYSEGLTMGDILRLLFDFYAAPLEPWEEVGTRG